MSQRRSCLLPLDGWLERIAREVYEPDGVGRGLKVRWRWCGLAVFFTTVVLDAEVLSRALRRALAGDVKPIVQRDKLSHRPCGCTRSVEEKHEAVEFVAIVDMRDRCGPTLSQQRP